jgi:hypothetical protein
MTTSIFDNSVSTFADDIGFEHGEEVVGDTVKTGENVDLFGIAKEMIDEVPDDGATESPDEDYDERCSLPDCLQELKDTVGLLAAEITRLSEMTKLAVQNVLDEDLDNYQPGKKGSPGRPDKTPPRLVVTENKRIELLATKVATKAAIDAVSKVQAKAQAKARAQSKAQAKAQAKARAQAKAKAKAKVKPKVKAKIVSKKPKRR